MLMKENLDMILEINASSIVKNLTNLIKTTECLMYMTL